LLRLAGNRAVMGAYVNSRATTILLIATLLMALVAGAFKAKELFPPPAKAPQQTSSVTPIER
ncbi:MAG TPA: hypothetical protein DDW52_07455, partial [Planctomycetaceae bacterium]|nr:hypothetical protein [Planctomycetaceae bacterium]